VRARAISYLGRMRTEAAVGALEEVLRDAGDERTRAATLSALAYHASPRARQVLRTYAERNDVPVRLRTAALDALARDTSAANVQWLRTLYGRADTAVVRERVLAAVARMPGAESASWLQGIARDEGTPLRLRRTALASYLRRQPPIAEVVRAYDAFGERELRDAVIGELGRRKEPEATDKLMTIARGDDDSRMRRAAIELLARKAKDDPRTAKLLMEIIGQ
jgi:HEAT repeat protein